MVVSMIERQKLMAQALVEGKKAYKKGEIPVGAVLVKDGKVIAKAHNLVESKKNPTHHAEILLINKGVEILKEKWLLGCDVYVSLEPCAMCAYALVLARVRSITFGAYDKKRGFCGSVGNIPQHPGANHKIKVYPGVLEEESSALISAFFQDLRKGKVF